MTEYEAYLKSQWWWDLTYKLIDCNGSARCFICHKRTHLLLHHVDYRALYKEKLNKDVYILCYECHTSTHFWVFKLIKVPLKVNALLFSMRMRRVLNCLNDGELAIAVGWFLVTVIIGSWFLLVWLLAIALKLLLDILLKIFIR